MADYEPWGPVDTPEGWARVEVAVSYMPQENEVGQMHSWLSDPVRVGRWYWWGLTDGYGVRTSMVVTLTEPLAFEFKIRWA